MKFLGINIHNISREEVLAGVRVFLDGKHFSQIVTVNPEFILEAQDNRQFREILNTADLSEVDGIGVVVGLLAHGARARHRIPGVDLMDEVLSMANKKGMRVGLIGNVFGLSAWQEAVGVLQKRYPNVLFSGKDIRPQEYDRELAGFDTQAIDILFVGTGAPYQEYCIDFLRRKNPGSVKLAMGVGGSFDFVTGKVRRAPKLIRRIGMEWLWRLWEQPKRIKREMRKLALYPLLVVFRELPPPFLKFLQSPREYRFMTHK